MSGNFGNLGQKSGNLGNLEEKFGNFGNFFDDFKKFLQICYESLILGVFSFTMCRLSLRLFPVSPKEIINLLKLEAIFRCG